MLLVNFCIKCNTKRKYIDEIAFLKIYDGQGSRSIKIENKTKHYEKDEKQMKNTFKKKRMNKKEESNMKFEQIKKIYSHYKGM